LPFSGLAGTVISQTAWECNFQIFARTIDSAEAAAREMISAFLAHRSKFAKAFSIDEH
jgi:hypothetical protein